MKPLELIAITGIDGSGKSTLVKELAGSHPEKYLSLSLWENLSHLAATPLGQLAMPGKLDEFLEQLSFKARLSFFSLLWNEALVGLQALDRSDSISILLDGYWYKYLAFCLALEPDETEIDPMVIERFIEQFPRPEKIFLLELDPGIAAERKQSFGVAECGFTTMQSKADFVSFQTKVQKILEDIVLPLGAIKIAAEKLIDQTIEEISLNSSL